MIDFKFLLNILYIYNLKYNLIISKIIFFIINNFYQNFEKSLILY